MSVATHLTGLASNLIPSANEKDSIQRSIITLKTRLSKYFASDIKEQIRFGSSTRDTMLTRRGDELSDVDYMVVFDNSAQLKPQSLIERLRKFAEREYARSEIFQSHPTVVLNLNHIRFELVPAHRTWLGLQIPAPAGGYVDWIATDPNGFNAQLEQKNKAEGSLIKPLIRLLKYWNAREKHVFESFQLENWVIGQWFISSGSLKPYVFEAFQSLQTKWDMPQWKKDRIARVKDVVQRTKELESKNMPEYAELEIAKILPDL